MVQVYETEAYKLGSFDSICNASEVYEIVKTKDFNRCIERPIFQSVNPSMHIGSFGSARVGEAVQRSAMYRYLACGPSYYNMTVVHMTGLADFLAKPFGINTEELSSNDQIALALEWMEPIGTPFTIPANPIVLNNLTYIFPENDYTNGASYPTLTAPFTPSPMPTAEIIKSVMEVLRIVAADLKFTPNAEQDNLERLTTLSRALPMLSLEELRSVWAIVKDEEAIIVKLFLDAAVEAGSNPAVMLIKELIETEQIKGSIARWAVGALAYTIKTPTRELLIELLNLFKSTPVQSFKGLKQTTLLAVADVLHSACNSTLKHKRFPINFLGELCDAKDTIIIDEFLPLLAKELEAAKQVPTDLMIALTAAGSLGVEEVIPVLLPFIRGSPLGDDAPIRIRAILSLRRVLFTAPEKVLPVLLAVADNIAERDEVRMAAISLLVHGNAPFVMWQKLALRTWTEPSVQIHSYIYTTIRAIAKMPPSIQVHKELVTKAVSALPLVKPAPLGLPYSWSIVRSSYLPEGQASYTHTPMWRIADEILPTFVGHEIYHQFGPFVPTFVQAFMFNFNMESFWKTLANKMTGIPAAETEAPIEALKTIWEQIKATPRPADMKAGLLQIELMNSIHRVFDLSALENIVPAFVAEFMKFQSTYMPVNWIKFRKLVDIDVRMASEIGLPMRFMSHLPFLVAVHGGIKPEGFLGVNASLTSQFAWKLHSELRIELPVSKNYIATGVDVRGEINLPKNFTIKYTNGLLNYTLAPCDATTDLFYYHVKPYTISRHISEIATPAVEHPAVSIMNVKEVPFTRYLDLASRYGLNIALNTTSELDHMDFASWFEWFQKREGLSFLNVAFIPMNLRAREYKIRYSPENTTAALVNAFVQFSSLYKSNPKTVVYTTGSDVPVEPTTEYITTGIVDEYNTPIAERVLAPVEGGLAKVWVAGFKAVQQDGSHFAFNASIASAEEMVELTGKHIKDIRIEAARFAADGSKINTEYVVCGTHNRNWNNPSSYGFTPEVLYMTEDAKYGFGATCEDSKLRIKAKIYRDESVVAAVRSSFYGEKCEEALKNGEGWYSDACYEAREFDHTYNTYEVSTESQNIPAVVMPFVFRIRHLFNTIISPFVVDHRYESNAANRVVFSAKRDPFTGQTNMTVTRPTESLIVRNLRGLWFPTLPLVSSAVKVLYPLKACETYANVATRFLSANVTDAKCIVGPKTVSTFDGVAYNYTMNTCDHVLVTDSFKKHSIAVLAREAESRKIVTVIYGKDIVIVDPLEFVSINGAKKTIEELKSVDKFEIINKSRVALAIEPVTMGVKVMLPALNMWIKIQGSHITINGARALRGKATGMCGDYNQESTAEFRTGARCAVSSGHLMAASFSLPSKGCARLPVQVAKALKKETEMCYSVDEIVPSYVPEIDIAAPTKCSEWKPLIIKQGAIVFSSTVPALHCFPGCTHTAKVYKPFEFQSTESVYGNIRVEVEVPAGCVSL